MARERQLRSLWQVLGFYAAYFQGIGRSRESGEISLRPDADI
jgi:hypothetical protein